MFFSAHPDAIVEQLEMAIDERNMEIEKIRSEREAARQQVAALQTELQEILATCGSLEGDVLQLENARQQAEEDLLSARQQTEALRDGVFRRSDQDRRLVQDLQTQLLAAQHDLELARADRKDALLLAHSLHTSYQARSEDEVQRQEKARHEEARSLYLQKEVDRLASACHDNREKQAAMQQELHAQQLLIQTLEAQIEESAGGRSREDETTLRLQEVAERARSDKAFLHQQLIQTIGHYSHSCRRQQQLVEFVEEACVVFREAASQIAAAIRDLTQSCTPDTDTRSLQFLLEQKQRDLEYALDKQLVLTREADKAKAAARDASLAHEKANAGKYGGMVSTADLEKMKDDIRLREEELSRLRIELEQTQTALNACKERACAAQAALEAEQIRAEETRLHACDACARVGDGASTRGAEDRWNSAQEAVCEGDCVEASSLRQQLATFQLDSTEGACAATCDGSCAQALSLREKIEQLQVKSGKGGWERERKGMMNLIRVCRRS